MEKKQTAVESLIENLKVTLPKAQFNDCLMQDLFKQAKQMEKEQIIEAHGIKESHGAEGSRNFWQQTTGEQYYNETYGGKP